LILKKILFNNNLYYLTIELDDNSYKCKQIFFQHSNKKEEEIPLDEVTKDIASIMNIYTSKINGLRKYKKK
jgi:hypothetical protein